MPATPNEIIAFIEQHNGFAIMGHEDPDGDCLGSQLALGSFLERLGKSVRLLSPGPYDRTEITDLSSSFSSSMEDFEPDAVLILDCSTPERTGSLADMIDGYPTGVIDHHASGNPFGVAQYIDVSAPSVTYLIFRLIEAMGHEPTRQEADWLLFGLCTDTGYFRHLSVGSGAVFEVVSHLVDTGSSPKAMYHQMYGHQNLASRRLVGRLLQRAEPLFDGRVLVTWEDSNDRTELGCDSSDSDTVYRELQRVEHNEAVVLIREESTGSCSVGLRSLTDLDVGRIAHGFGGGGHKNAAGYSVDGSIEEVRNQIIAAIEVALVHV